MPKPIQEMSSFGASAHPSRIPEGEMDEAWEATRMQTGMATQLMKDKEDYLAAPRKTVGRQVGPSEWELFVACEPADAMQQQFETLAPEFITLHDIGVQSSRRMLVGLAAAMNAPVHQLNIRRQGVGMPMARLEFVELPLGQGGDASGPLRLYTTEIDADTAQRRHLARTLLAFSRMGVVMVGDLPPHALATALKSLREALTTGPWPNRELLMLPLAGASTLAAQASHIAAGTSVQVRVTPQVARPADAWSYLRSSWNRLRGQLSDGAVFVPELLDPKPAQTSDAPLPVLGSKAAGVVPPLPMQPMPMPRPSVDAPSIDPALATYLRRCGELKGLISCCIFELATQRTLGHAGGRPGPAALASHGASLMAAMAEAAQALNLGGGAPDAAITYAAHHELLRAVPARRGLALHAVLDKNQNNLALVRLQLQRLDLLLDDGATD